MPRRHKGGERGRKDEEITQVGSDTVSSGGHDAVGWHYGLCGRWGRGRGVERVGLRLPRSLRTVVVPVHDHVPFL